MTDHFLQWSLFLGEPMKLISLKLNKEFKRAYFGGRFKSYPLLTTYLVKNRLGKSRIGITTSKKIGGAVQRNRARRIIKQAYTELVREKEVELYGVDLVFVARKDTTTSTTKQIKMAMKKQLNQLLSTK